MKRLLYLCVLLTATAFAADPEFTLVIKDHRFEPSELTVPSGKKRRGPPDSPRSSW